MGWSSGSEILGEVWGTVRKHIPEKNRVNLLAKLMVIFENHDCDTVEELVDDYKEAKEAYIKVNPDAFTEEEEYDEEPEDIL